MIAYEVTATLRDQGAQAEYLDWLRGGHAAALLHWAERAEVIALDPPCAEGPWRVKSVYLFSGREAYTRYVEEGAPALRAEGLALALRLGGISFERTLGEVWGCEPLG